jgi:hypothetical protein
MGPSVLRGVDVHTAILERQAMSRLDNTIFVLRAL